MTNALSGPVGQLAHSLLAIDAHLAEMKSAVLRVGLPHASSDEIDRLKANLAATDLARREVITENAKLREDVERAREQLEDAYHQLSETTEAHNLLAQLHEKCPRVEVQLDAPATIATSGGSPLPDWIEHPPAVAGVVATIPAQEEGLAMPAAGNAGQLLGPAAETSPAPVQPSTSGEGSGDEARGSPAGDRSAGPGAGGLQPPADCSGPPEDTDRVARAPSGAEVDPGEPGSGSVLPPAKVKCSCRLAAPETLERDGHIANCDRAGKPGLSDHTLDELARGIAAAAVAGPAILGSREKPEPDFEVRGDDPAWRWGWAKETAHLFHENSTDAWCHSAEKADRDRELGEGNTPALVDAERVCLDCAEAETPVAQAWKNLRDEACAKGHDFKDGECTRCTVKSEEPELKPATDPAKCACGQEHRESGWAGWVRRVRQGKDWWLHSSGSCAFTPSRLAALTADESIPPEKKKKPRDKTCRGPGCSVQGSYPKNDSGARAASVRVCDLHAARAKELAKERNVALATVVGEWARLREPPKQPRAKKSKPLPAQEGAAT